MGLFGRKKDFWDEVDSDARIPDIPDSELTREDEERIQQQLAAIDESGWHPTKSRAVKLLARVVLMVAAMAILFSGYIIYKYVRSGGTWTSAPDYYQSGEFMTEYNRSVGQLLELVEAIDSQSGTSRLDSEVDQELIDSYLPTDGNFAFVVYDGMDNEVVKSGEDAVSRIESSGYFLRLSSVDGGFSVDSSLPQSQMDTGAWEDGLTNCSETYTIYTSVDNQLKAADDGFYKSYESFQSLTRNFSLARITGLAGLILFILCLVFCVVAAGSVKGYDGVKLCWVDKIFTELAIIIAAALAVGCYFLYTYFAAEGRMNDILLVACVALAYIFVIECYFSLVRRIKAGTFVTGMLVYKLINVLGKAIGRLPKPARVAVTLLLLLLINGGMIVALFTCSQYAVLGIPVVYVLIPIVFVIENVCFISWILHNNPDMEEEPEEETEGQAEAEEAGKAEILGETAPLDLDFADPADISPETAQEDPWATVRLDDAVADAVKSAEATAAGLTAEAAAAAAGEETVMLPKDEIETMLAQGAALAESGGAYDFTQLNKDIRKLHRASLKAHGVAVTIRAPEKPILLDVPRGDVWKIISLIYDNLEQYTKDNTRIYAEMYTQAGKLIYIVKNEVKATALDAAKAIADTGIPKDGKGLGAARKIVEAHGGKFVISLDGNIFKTGVLLSLAGKQ